MNLKLLVGSGESIGLFTLPALAVGVLLNVVFPSAFSVGGPSPALFLVSAVVLACGIVNWLWSVLLILTKVPRHQLITQGPYALVRHPLYTGMAFLVLPWLGFLLNSWLGVVIGGVLYAGSRRFSPREERDLARTFGAAWDAYCQNVKFPWL
jgi:protein-S-isoprenylcysteine O-methyltransferase Ste14